MLIATFGPSTGWAGKTIDYDSGVFTLEGHGPISVEDVLTYDREGHLTWAYDGLREWVQQMAGGHVAPPAAPQTFEPQPATSQPGAQPPRQKSRALRSILIVVGAIVGLLIVLLVIGLGIRGGSSDKSTAAAERPPVTYSNSKYGISFSIPGDFSATKIEVSPAPGSLWQIGEWANPGTQTTVVLYVMDASKEKDPREIVIMTVKNRMSEALKMDGISLKRSFSWVDNHPAYMFSASSPSEPASGRVMGAAIAGKPFSYLLMFQRSQTDTANLTGATAESLLTSMRFIGEVATWHIDPTGYSTYRNRSDGYSLKYPDRFLLGGTAKGGSGGTLGIIDAASASAIAPDNGTGFLAIRAVNTPHRLTLAEVKAFPRRVLDSGKAQEVMGSVVANSLTSSKVLSVSPPRELHGYASPTLDAVVTWRTSTNKTERIHAYLLVTPAHLLMIWLHPGGDAKSMERIVRSIRAVS